MISSSHNVYMILSKKNGNIKTYVGYSTNINKRIKSHNLGKGAKSTRGRIWRLIYKKRFNNKSKALKYEYRLKKNKILR